eukprot:jgi/Chlat1/6383/Chrsp44S05844
MAAAAAAAAEEQEKEEEDKEVEVEVEGAVRAVLSAVSLREYAAVRRGRTLRQRCTLGCPVLDACLGGGGVATRCLTELVGESTSGKTRTCAQLLLTCQLPLSQGGLAGSAVYISTEVENVFVQALGEALKSGAGMLARAGLSGNPTDAIFTDKAHTSEELWDLLRYHLPTLISQQQHTQRPMRLLVIDSIAAVFKSDFDNVSTELAERTQWMFRISQWLKRLADAHNMAVVITNHVVDYFPNASTGFAHQVEDVGRFFTSGRHVAPALGLGWANCVNVRLFLSRTERWFHAESDENRTKPLPLRCMRIVFAPFAPALGCEFVIDDSGVRGINLLQS